ncbi:MAG: phosphoribosyltransferase family protein [Acidobacteriota bacterium]
MRKEAKKHGMMRLIEGNVKKGDRVVIVDDVCTTGGSMVQAVEACVAEGIEIAAVMPLVDREEGGAETFARYRFLPLFRASEFRA